MLVKNKKRYAITTNSNHPFRKYRNRILGKEIKHKDQVWVSDITYIRLKKGFCYVSLITDLYSRKIVGYHANSTLELEGCVLALKKAYKGGKPKTHHSDRGTQYCSYVYTDLLKKKAVKISMTEDGNCYENAVAERVNGILKNEFNLNIKFEDIKQVRKALKQAVETYNSIRPSWAIDLKRPDELYQAA